MSQSQTVLAQGTRAWHTLELGHRPAGAVAVEERPVVCVMQLVLHLMGCNLVLTLIQPLVAPAHLPRA